MTKALITGGAGFIGLHLARRLTEQNLEVDLLDNFSRGAKDRDLEELCARPGVRLLSGDLLADGFVETADDDYQLIFHFAAIIGVANVLRQPYRVLADNTALTAAAVELGRRQKKLERLIFASTSEVYAGALENFELRLPTPEDAPLALTDLASPRTSYMLSKIMGEAMCRHCGLPFTIIRPHNVYGPRMGLAHVIPELMGKAHRAEEGSGLEVFSVGHRRTFCFVSDAVEMIARAAVNPGCLNETLNIGAPGPEVTIGRLAELVLKTVGKNLDIQARPATPGSPLRRCPDMAKTMGFTGYEPQISLEQGLQLAWDWYRPRVFEAGQREAA